MQIEGISQDPLTDRVIRRIRDMIWHGEVMAGEYLPSQPVLASQFGVGLSTVREAVKALSLIGLLDARPGRGTRVLPDALKILNSDVAMRTNLAHVEASEIWEARLVIEVSLACMAAERATAEDLTAIQVAFQEMQCALDDDDEFTRADMRFHLAVARASKNDVLAQTYYLIHNLLQAAVREADTLPGGKHRALANHARILEGIRTRNPALAREASERQIADVSEYAGGNLVDTQA